MISFIRKVIDHRITVFYCLLIASIIEGFGGHEFKGSVYFFCAIFYYGCIRIEDAILNRDKLNSMLSEIKNLIEKN